MSSSQSAPAPGSGDAEIVRLMKERDGTGLRRLLEAHGGIVRAALKKSLGAILNESEIDDALNTATFRAWRRIDSFDAEKGSLRGWFLVVARNAGHELLRERQRLGWETRGDEIEALPAPGESGSATHDASELQPAPSRRFVELLRECIDELPRLQRRVVQADLASGDVADAGALAKAMKTTRNSVYVSRSNARRALRQALLARGCSFDEITNTLTWIPR